MGNVLNQARKARLRLTTERFLGYLPWTMCIGFAVAAVAISLPKIVPMQVDGNLWFAIWLTVCSTIALITAISLTLVGRPTLNDSAAEVDRRFGLRERLSSSMMLSAEDRASELGQALVSDAEKRASALDVRDKFRWGLRRSLLIPILPAALAAALLYVPNKSLPSINGAAEIQDVTQVKNSTKSLLEEIKKKRKDAEDQGLNAAVDLFKQLEGKISDLQKDKKLDSKQTMAKLNDIREQLDERRKELGSSEAMKKNLQNLSKFEAGPAEKLKDAMKNGDFEKAENAMEELLEKMKSGGLSDQDQQNLQKQLQQLEKALSESAAAHEQAKQALKEQMEQAEAAGDLQKAAQLQRKLEQMQASDASMQQMQQMAEALAKAQQSMRDGDMEGAQEALEQMASQMQQMNQADSELQDLDELMDSLSQSKSQMMCKQCNGAGCASCMGSMPQQQMGSGMGQGTGQGDRPEEETDTDFFESRVRDQMKIGETVNGGKVGGENRKGTTRSEVQEAVLSSLSEEPEPLDDTPLPKTQRDHTRDYFNSIREGN